MNAWRRLKYPGPIAGAGKRKKENTMLEKRAAGEQIVSACTKCKLALDHTIVAMVGETIAKVKCKTCGSIHKYRDPADAGKPRGTRTKDAPVKTSEMLWEACIAEASGPERAYDMTATYQVGDLVLHAIFGRGVVRKLSVNKCDILFKDKERMMASAN
jgi:CxxC motif-containing protein